MCRVVRDRSLGTVRALRGVAIVRVSQMCARLRGSSRFLVVLFVFLRVSCSVCVIVLGADVSESARCERAGG